MGLLGRQGKPNPSVVEMETIFIEDAQDSVAVVGESNYQGAIRRACGAKRGEAVRFDGVGILVPEPDNQFDPNAVSIYVADGGKVGYLTRDDAIDYQEAVQTAASADLVISCPALIAGRGRDGDTTNLGVFLKLPPPDELLLEVRKHLDA